MLSIATGDRTPHTPAPAAIALRWAREQTDPAMPALLRVWALRSDDRVRQLMVHLNSVLPSTIPTPPPKAAVPNDPKLASLIACTGVRAYVDAAVAAAAVGALGQQPASKDGPLAGVALGARGWDGKILMMWRGPDEMPSLGVSADTESGEMPPFSLVGQEPTGDSDSANLCASITPGRHQVVPKWGDYDAEKKARLPNLGKDQQKTLRDLYQLEYLEQQPAMVQLFALTSAEETMLAGAHKTPDYRRYVQELMHQVGVKDGTLVRPQVVRCDDGVIRVHLELQDFSGQWRHCPTLRADELARALCDEATSA